MCYRYKANTPPTRAKGIRLAGRCSVRGGNPCDYLSEPLIATIYQINAELATSRGHCECNKFGGYMHRRDVDDGFWVLQRDVAYHRSP
jgi:hypothetical protein